MGAHNRNRTWSIIEACDVPTGRRLIRMLWVYKIKRDGTLKSRLCVQGSSQKIGEDFDQTYCATMRATSLRLLGAVSVALSLRMRRIDFISAYLQGKLEEGEVVYCHMPEGYATYGKDGRKNVLRVEKAHLRPCSSRTPLAAKHLSLVKRTRLHAITIRSACLFPSQIQ